MAEWDAFLLIKEASAKADAELSDPVKHVEWLKRWHESLSIRGAKHYKTLRGFTIAQLTKQQTTE